MTGSLTGRTALVIGGSGSIGYAIAAALAGAGAAVAVSGRRADRVADAVARLESAGATASGHPCDITDPEAARALVGSDAFPGRRLDILVNCQGTTVIKPTVEVTIDEFDTVLDTNLRSVWLASLAAHARMAPQGGGSIISIASLAAHRGWPLAAAYAASKHAVIGLSRTLASEWATDGIRVNTISPGFFLTELNRDRMSQARKDAALARTPARRFGEAPELGAAAVFLASDGAGFVTGTDVPVDGGYLASGI